MKPFIYTAKFLTLFFIMITCTFTAIFFVTTQLGEKILLWSNDYDYNS